MGDENFDPCECVWGHELAMRRLLSLLRQSQSYCTDSECFQDGASVVPTAQTPDQNFFLVTMFFLFALLMFFIRPRPQENSSFEPNKSHVRENNGSDGSPPNPPPASC